MLCANVGTSVSSRIIGRDGGAGAVDLGSAVLKTMETQAVEFPSAFIPTTVSLEESTNHRARNLRRSRHHWGSENPGPFKELQEQGYGHFPSASPRPNTAFHTDPDFKGAPKHHVVPIREVRLSAGAEFIVAICGNIMTMPGLPKVPAANNIDVTPEGKIVGLF